MNLREVFERFKRQLLSYYDDNESVNISELVFDTILGVKKQDILMKGSTEIPPSKAQEINEIAARLQNNEPVQYILGEAWFYHLPFKVTNAVLIPRPETEELAWLCIKFIEETNPKNLIDIGTGSGCIAVTIKNHYPQLLVDAIDVSEGALAIAAENAAKLKTNVNFSRIDFLNEAEWGKLGNYDIIISNPPYIPISGKDKMNVNVTAFEPHLALFTSDEDPFIFYRKIAAFAIEHLNKNGKIFTEVHEDYAKNVAEIFMNKGLNTTIIKDMQGKERIVTALFSF